MTTTSDATTNKNYHNAVVTFRTGDSVKFISDIGEIVPATILAIIDENTLGLTFGDGDYGDELTVSCYH